MNFIKVITGLMTLGLIVLWFIVWTGINREVHAQGPVSSIGTSQLPGLSVTRTVRTSGGASDCTLIFTGGVLTGGSCAP